MKPSSSVAKSCARAVLKGKWMSAIGVCTIGACGYCVKMLITELLGMIFLYNSVVPEQMRGVASAAISVFALLIDIFLFSPLYIGALEWFWHTTAGQDVPVVSVFNRYGTLSDYKKCVFLRFSFYARMCGIFILCEIPYFILSAVMSVIGVETESVLFLFALILFITGLVVAAVVVCRYFAVLPVMFSDDSLSVPDIFTVAKKVAAGNLTSFVILLLSFVGWIILCLLALSLIYTAPYMAASVMIYARHSINNFAFPGRVSAAVEAE